MVKTTLDEGVRGFYQYFQKNKLIYINSNLPDNEKRVVCAHELGHAMLHKKVNVLFLESNTYFVKNRYEIEANEFAAELIVDSDILSKYPNLTIDQIAAAEDLPINLIKLKFK